MDEPVSEAWHQQLDQSAPNPPPSLAEGTSAFAGARDAAPDPIADNTALLQPANFSIIDPLFAAERLTIAARFAERVLGVDGIDFDGTVLRKLAMAAVDKLIDGTCDDGLQLDDLADRAGVSRGRLDPHLKGILLVAVDITIRALFALDRRRIWYEEWYTVAVEARRDSKRKPGGGRRVLGFQQRQQTPGSLRLTGMALSGSVYELGASEITLTTGTHHDHSATVADDAEIAYFSDLLGERPAGPLHEHVRLLLAIETRARTLLVRASKFDRAAFAMLDVEPEQFLGAFCTDLVLAGPMPVGAPERRRRLFRDLINPGDDPATLHELIAQGRSGVALCTLDEAVLTATPEQLLAMGWRKVDVDARAFLRRLGVDQPVFGREWWHHPASHRMVRKIAVRGGGMAVDVQMWQLFGPRRSSLIMAMGLIERHHQPWPSECLHTAAEQCAPGRVYQRLPEQQAGARAVMRVGRASAVIADREARKPNGRRRGGAA
jgi:hypothetical protein